ncbi:STAS domain-containing protein [Rhodobacter maris]|uniref:STAS domain-containing protein n=1 Tax=Rhodobacter maris TaxID=446682 RepID=A0A285SB57_9RHOB|nr:STAS domain-containing protein [Rhodobacter maris]SOC04729.1 STAS domain-containing protein [Rhodobacter maris]
MSNETRVSSALDTIMLAEEVGLRDASELYASLLRAFECGGPVVVDASHAVSMHVSALQVLAAASRHAAEQGKGFTLIAPESCACVNAFSRAGMTLPAAVQAA